MEYTDELNEWSSLTDFPEISSHPEAFYQAHVPSITHIIQYTQSYSVLCISGIILFRNRISVDFFRKFLYVLHVKQDNHITNIFCVVDYASC